MSSIVEDYPREEQETPIIVDCGGGKIGLVTAILDAHPFFRAIVQDLENVVTLTNSIMKERRPCDIESGILKVEVYDFFRSQPRIENEYSFILHHILHDWPDKEAAAILGNVACALGPKSKILIIKMRMVSNVNSNSTTSTRSFLLDGNDKHSNYSLLHSIALRFRINVFSLNMLTFMNGCERSSHEWESLINGCGFCITRCGLTLPLLNVRFTNKRCCDLNREFCFMS
ncbi:S-adenosyl-L-methionine-dependent methyltransferase [Suillus decipiens]|nr:S-adenosyl-L-methionine-dependent methyltransferase [Suillus decipiens]